MKLFVVGSAEHRHDRQQCRGAIVSGEPLCTTPARQALNAAYSVRMRAWAMSVICSSIKNAKMNSGTAMAVSTKAWPLLSWCERLMCRNTWRK